MRAAIIGTAPYHKTLAPFDDGSWEIWVCSPGNRRLFSRVTRWFELHGVDDMKGPENEGWNKDYFEWLKAQPFPVYMQEPNDLLPQARVFPRDAWLRKFGRLGRLAATSSISWMIGFALMEGAKEVAIFGVDMSDVSEAYSLQKSGCSIMMILAEEQYGCKVSVPLSSCLATMPPLYGYAEASRMGRKLWVREQTFKEQAELCQKQMNDAERRMYLAQGQLEEIRYMRRTFVDGEHDAEIDVQETQAKIGGRDVSVTTSRNATVTLGSLTTEGVEVDHHPRPTRVPNGLDPSQMEVTQLASGVYVPKPNGDEHGDRMIAPRAEE